MEKKTLSEVVSVRIDKPLLEHIEELATKDMRTRANQILVLLNRSVSAIDVVSRHLEYVVKTLHEEEGRNPLLAEYWRGELHAVKWLLALFCGERVKGEVLDHIRERTKLPIPHIVPLAEDGNRYGFDSDAG